MQATVNNVMIRITQGHILTQTTDAIVHDTDSGLSVGKIWAEAAGEKLVYEASMIGWCDIGAVVITTGGNLDAKNVIHTVGPRWGDASARGKLGNVTWEALQLAEDNQLVSVSHIPISTGAKGYPVENCAKMMMAQIINFTFEPLDYLREIVVCVQTDEEQAAFHTHFKHQLDDLKNDDNVDDVIVG